MLSVSFLDVATLVVKFQMCLVSSIFHLDSIGSDMQMLRIFFLTGSVWGLESYGFMAFGFYWAWVSLIGWALVVDFLPCYCICTMYCLGFLGLSSMISSHLCHKKREKETYYEVHKF